MTMHRVGFYKKQVPPAIDLVHTGSADDESDLPSYTFSGMSLGGTTANKYFVVVSYNGGGNSISSVSIDSMTATQDVEFTDGNIGVGVFHINATGNTTGPVTVNFSGTGAFGVLISVYRVTNFGSVSDSFTSTGASGSMDIPAGGAGLAGAYGEDTGSLGWSGLTENADLQSGANNRYGAASGKFATAQTGLSISASGADVIAGIALSP
jgi:hypothetical protein